MKRTKQDEINYHKAMAKCHIEIAKHTMNPRMFMTAAEHLKIADRHYRMWKKLDGR